MAEEGGPLRRLIPALLVVAFLSLAFATTLDLYKERFSFNTTKQFESTYDYTSSLTEDVTEIQEDITNETDIIDAAKRVPSLVTGSFSTIGNIINNAAKILGLPSGVGTIFVSILLAIIVVYLLFAIASIFLQRPI